MEAESGSNLLVRLAFGIIVLTIVAIIVLIVRRSWKVRKPASTKK